LNMLLFRPGTWIIIILVTIPATAQPTWSKLEGVMPTPRSEMGGGYIGGKFYLTGGYNNSADVLDVSEVYDHAAQSWTTFAPLPEPLEHHMVEAVGDKLYVFKERTHVYDPATNEWIEGLGSVSRPDGTTCVDGTDVYVMGGFVDLLQKYDSQNDSWQDLPPMERST